MIASRYKPLLAALIGTAFAGSAMLAFDTWLTSLVDRHGREEVDLSARRTVELAGQRIDRVFASLDGLARRGVDNCRGTAVEALRQAAFVNPFVKDIAVVGADGQVLCSSSAGPVAQMRVVSSQPVAPSGQGAIELVGGGKESMLRIVRRADGKIGLAALVPAELLGAPVSRKAAEIGAFVVVTMRDGAVVSRTGGDAAPDADRFVAVRRSDRDGLAVTVSLPRAGVQVDNSSLYELGGVLGGGAALAIVALAVVGRRRSRNDPVSELETAIRNNEFVPFYQPVVDIRTGRLRGAEVLIRWRKADGTIVLPAAFIPLAESSGLIIALTRALMRRVCEENGDVIGERPDLKIGFNLTALHFDDETIVRDVHDIFGPSPMRLNQVLFEVTERQPLENLAAARRVIASLQDLGCAVAIDDVGTGHGGLSYLLKLGADTIKIDKMFIDAIGTEHHSTTIIETLVDLARHMRMDVVAEGVENFEQVVQLRELGILAAQGHVFCPPLPGASFRQLIEAIVPLTPQGTDHVELDEADGDPVGRADAA